MKKEIAGLSNTKYITPKKEDVARRFTEYNEKYFDGVLPPCKFSISKTESGGEYNINYNRIKIGKNNYWTEESLKLVLIHEMVHHYVRRILNRKPTFTHGRTFNKVCDMLRKKHGLKVKMYELPYLLRKGKKEPTLFKRVLVRCFWWLFRF